MNKILIAVTIIMSFMCYGVEMKYRSIVENKDQTINKQKTDNQLYKLQLNEAHKLNKILIKRIYELRD